MKGRRGGLGLAAVSLMATVLTPTYSFLHHAPAPLCHMTPRRPVVVRMMSTNPGSSPDSKTSIPFASSLPLDPSFSGEFID